MWKFIVVCRSKVTGSSSKRTIFVVYVLIWIGDFVCGIVVADGADTGVAKRVILSVVGATSNFRP